MKVWEQKRSWEGLAILNTGHAWEGAVVLGPDRGPRSRFRLFQGSSVCQVTAVGVTVILLYTSRACYNLFILSFSQSKNVHSFDYDWYNVSDQVSGHWILALAACLVAERCQLLAPAAKELGDLASHLTGWCLHPHLSNGITVPALFQLTCLLRKLENRHTSCYILGILSSST